MGKVDVQVGPTNGRIRFGETVGADALRTAGIGHGRVSRLPGHSPSIAQLLRGILECDVFSPLTTLRADQIGGSEAANKCQPIFSRY